MRTWNMRLFTVCVPWMLTLRAEYVPLCPDRGDLGCAAVSLSWGGWSAENVQLRSCSPWTEHGRGPRARPPLPHAEPPNRQAVLWGPRPWFPEPPSSEHSLRRSGSVETDPSFPRAGIFPLGLPSSLSSGPHDFGHAGSRPFLH